MSVWTSPQWISVVLKLLCDPCVQKSVGPEQNPLRLPQNQELEQFLKEGYTFTVLDQPLSLDRLQLKNIDQLNASSKDWFFFCYPRVFQLCWQDMSHFTTDAK